MNLKNKTVKFCPLCRSEVLPAAKGQGMYSTCSSCGLEFVVRRRTPPPEPRVGCSTHKKECGAVGSLRGKVCHASVAEAYARCLVLDDIPHRYRSEMEFYQCRWCGKIHMGHGGKNRKNSIVSYTNEQAHRLYEQALQNGELLSFSEIIRK